MVHDSRTVLSFDHVTVEPRGRYDLPIWDMSFSLAAGELLLMLLEEEHVRLPLVDAAIGRVEYDSGFIRFAGDDWRDMSPRAATAARGRVGRVFEGTGWITNLDIGSNILLAQRHHSRRPTPAIMDEAADLARTFDLPGLPTGPIGGARGQDLRRAACVRAFLGEPRLVILERPTEGMFAELMPPLVNTVAAARRAGAAVLWTTTSPQVFDSRALRPSLRYRMFGSRARLIEEPVR